MNDSSASSSLLSRVRASDARAWQRFTLLYSPWAYGIARRAGLSESDAANVSQEVFMTAAVELSLLSETSALPLTICETVPSTMRRKGSSSDTMRTTSPIVPRLNHTFSFSSWPIIPGYIQRPCLSRSKRNPMPTTCAVRVSGRAFPSLTRANDVRGLTVPHGRRFTVYSPISSPVPQCWGRTVDRFG